MSGKANTIPVKAPPMSIPMPTGLKKVNRRWFGIV
jgi:hypothetical protein